MDIAYSWLIAVIIILLLSFTQFGIIRQVYSWFSDIIHLHSLPSPPGRWFFGHALEFGTSQRTLDYMQENHKKYPKLCVYWIGPFVPLVITANVDIMKTFLHQSGELQKPFVYNFFRRLTGLGLPVVSGKKWTYYRKLVSSAFHFDILKRYVPVYNEMSHKLLDLWSPFADSGKSVDVTKYTKQLTMDVQLKCMYLRNGDCLENRENPYFTAIDDLLNLIHQRIYTPFYAYDWIFFWTAAGRKFLQCCDIIHKYSYDVIGQRRMELQQAAKKSQPSIKHRDFIDTLLTIKDESGKNLTDFEIREQLDAFIAAGHDTTAFTLGWSLYCLAQNEEHQEKCRNEVRDILADRDSDEITWQDLSKLEYLGMCIKETLRLHPVAPMIGKLTSEDVVVHGYRIPKGTLVGLSLYTMHRDPLIWDNPEKFNPMRFSTENSKTMDPFSFLAFSAGPRNCIGQRIAIHELKVTLANVLNRFHLELDASHKVEAYFDLLHKPKNGIKIKLYSAA